MPKRLIFIVSDTFTITGRGIVLVPGLRPVRDERFAVGDPILLRRPDGLERQTRIAGLELPHPNPNFEMMILLKDLKKTDVPIGTEVWSI